MQTQGSKFDIQNPGKGLRSVTHACNLGANVQPEVDRLGILIQWGEKASRTGVHRWFCIINKHPWLWLVPPLMNMLVLFLCREGLAAAYSKFCFFRSTLQHPVIAAVILLVPSLILSLSERFNLLGSLVLCLPKASSTACQTQLALYTCTFSQS